MAKVTDDQQTKGNLGGPDLFLAPIGRIESENITRHFCNTCEKEFEGSPKIDYESPNERVADNLVLMEKGQYVCGTCNSSIAEYREFKKTDEGRDAGMARPLQAEGTKDPQSQPAATSATVAQGEGEGGVEKPATVEAAAATSAATAAVAAATTTASTKPQPAGDSVNSIAGMAVFDENARRLGTAKQVGVDSSQTVVLIITNVDGTEATVPWSRVKTVGEVVLLGDPKASQPAAATAAADESGKCPGCGFSNKADAKFCEECGSKLA